MSESQIRTRSKSKEKKIHFERFPEDASTRTAQVHSRRTRFKDHERSPRSPRDEKEDKDGKDTETETVNQTPATPQTAPGATAGAPQTTMTEAQINALIAEKAAAMAQKMIDDRKRSSSSRSPPPRTDRKERSPSLDGLSERFGSQRIAPISNPFPTKAEEEQSKTVADGFRRTIKWAEEWCVDPPKFGETRDPSYTTPQKPTTEGLDKLHGWVKAEQTEMQDALSRATRYLKKAENHAYQGALYNNYKRRYEETLQYHKREQEKADHIRAEQRRAIKKAKSESLRRQAQMFDDDDDFPMSPRSTHHSPLDALAAPRAPALAPLTAALAASSASSAAGSASASTPG